MDKTGEICCWLWSPDTKCHWGQFAPTFCITLGEKTSLLTSVWSFRAQVQTERFFEVLNVIRRGTWGAWIVILESHRKTSKGSPCLRQAYEWTIMDISLTHIKSLQYSTRVDGHEILCPAELPETSELHWGTRSNTGQWVWCHEWDCRDLRRNSLFTLVRITFLPSSF